MTGAMEAAAGFFALSEEEKREFASEDVHLPVRYGVCTKDEGLVKPRDFLKQYAHPLDRWIKYWPHSPSDYRYRKIKKKVSDFTVDILSNKLVQLIVYLTVEQGEDGNVRHGSKESSPPTDGCDP